MPISLKDTLARETMPSAPELVLQEGGGSVRCVACGHRCLIRPGRAGVCKVRFNEDGELRVPTGYIAGLQIDPIEKKPFYHAFPGRDALSFGMLGCDLHCSYCQNWVTSQALRDEAAVSDINRVTPERLVELARRNDAPVLVSTYNEPLITADWAVRVFEPACEAGLVCGFVSNGNATPEVLDFIRPFVRLYKIDLKSFDDKHYRQLGCTLANVLESVQRVYDMGFWMEIVTLVIPGFNDSDGELRGIAEFLAEISPNIPWHITAFHPDYNMTDPPRTSVTSLNRAYEIGKVAGLRYVYPGNVPGAFGDREDTQCPNCAATLIRRHGFRVLDNRMDGGACPDCQTDIPGVWQPVPVRKSDGTGIPRRVVL